MRIAIAGISHESITFTPLRMHTQDFLVQRGQEILDFPGVASAVSHLRIEMVPILVASGVAPSGPVEENTYLQMRAEILSGIEKAGQLDGVCLVLHGAMLVENIWSGETDLVREVRAIVGREVPICVRLDTHANLTNEFANKTNIWVGYRTAPHRDTAQTLERAMALLVQVIQEGLRPKPAFIHLPMLLQGEKATTAVEPMKSLLQMAQAIEQQPGILNAEVLLGHAWSDAAHTGPSVVVIAKDESHLAHARNEAKRLAQSMWDRRGEFTFDQEVIATVDEAIETALGAPESTVFVTDSGDNPTAGAPGDNPYFLSRLLARRVPDAVFASMPDAEVAGVCFAKGVGATVSVTLGGKFDTAYGMPVPVTGVVEHLYKGDERTKDASIATLRVGGVRILIPDIRKAFTLLDDFRKAGVNPLEHKIVVEKLGYLMPELRDAAPREIMVLSPGRSDMDLTRLPYQYLTRPCFPLDPDFEWHPIISNIAGYGGQ